MNDGKLVGNGEGWLVGCGDKLGKAVGNCEGAHVGSIVVFKRTSPLHALSSFLGCT